MTSFYNTSIFARWNDPMGTYAYSYVSQAELLVTKLKHLHEAIEEYQAEERQRMKEAEEEQERQAILERARNSRRSPLSENSENEYQYISSSKQRTSYTQEIEVSNFLKTFSSARIELVIARLEQQLLVSKRLCKIIEHYTISPKTNDGEGNNSASASATPAFVSMKYTPVSASTSSKTQQQQQQQQPAPLFGGVDWCAVASQLKAALAGFLQQLRLDILCATSILIDFERKKHAHRQQEKAENNYNQEDNDDEFSFSSSNPYERDPAESFVEEIATSLFTIPCEIYKMCNEVVVPLLEKASVSVSSIMDNMMTFSSPSSASLGGGGGGGTSVSRTSYSRQQNNVNTRDTESVTSAGGNTTTTIHQQQQNLPSPSSRHQKSVTGGASTTTPRTDNHNHNQSISVVSLNSSCQEYVNCLSLTSDPVVTALSVACRGNEHLHNIHIEMLRGLMSNVVLGLIRRHSLLTGAVRMIRDISQKYHRIVEGQTALRTIRESIALAMNEDDKVPEPDEKLVEVDNLGRLLQEVLATSIVMKETTTVLRHWAFESQPSSSADSSSGGPPTPSRHAFDNPSQVRTAVAQQHTKTNGLYLLQHLRNMSSLLRRVASACEKTLSQWSEPALNSFGKILEVHSAPLLQCARVMANAQTDMKQLIGLCKEKASQVDETRIIEDTLAVLGTTTTPIVYTSFDHQLKEIETLSRSIHSIGQRSTGILNDVVQTLCKPIAQNSLPQHQLLPFQYVDNEIDTLTNSLNQLCTQHDNILTNLKATTMATTGATAQSQSSSSTGTGTTSNALSLQEMTTSMNSARMMNEAEQRAVAASCSFERLYKICQEVDEDCNMYFRNRFKAMQKKKNKNTTDTSNKNSSTALKSTSQASASYFSGVFDGTNNNTTKATTTNSLENGDNDDETALDDDSLKTAGPSALLPPSCRNEDRVFTMNVLKGTIRHLETGEQHFLVVPRPDKVNSPADLNDYEDEFSVAFVGVEGLCEQVFSSRSSASLSHPPINIASASSLDVLARVGAAAAAANSTTNNAFSHLVNRGDDNGGGGNDHQGMRQRQNSGVARSHQQHLHPSSLHQRTHSGSSSLSGTLSGPSIHVTSASGYDEDPSYGQHQSVKNDSFSVSPTVANIRRMRSQTTVANRPPEISSNIVKGKLNTIQHHHHHQNQELVEGMTTQQQQDAITNSRTTPSSNSRMFMTPSSSSSPYQQQHQAATINPHGDNYSLVDNKKLIRRSFTYQAAMSMPSHEMVPPSEY